MMREVMQAAGLSGFAQIGILLFFGSFLLIVINALYGMSDAEREEALRMPLDGPEMPDEGEPQGR